LEIGALGLVHLVIVAHPESELENRTLFQNRGCKWLVIIVPF
jgi:hypothetical protein